MTEQPQEDRRIVDEDVEDVEMEEEEVAEFKRLKELNPDDFE
ncbi:hypothetical protein [Nonomuraea wenchangensis]|uniref:Uncharacterized protein n=1 Tax=Nonomuraea wenchangensis TaxID=568860 RepID=A0A1I0BWM8_9ACTN|nr:hypothetical protein [Nonomuraea wenchangensis]SET11449.1 hypothetical protein SAMN05421811_10292 [Nonomuraea wenchangensis]